MSNTAIKIFIGTSDSQDKIIEQVYLFSLFKNTDAELDITFMRPKKMGWTRNNWGTPFTSFRYAVPELCNFKGRAIYTDVDMINFRDIKDLWETDLEGKPMASAWDFLCDNTVTRDDGWWADSVLLFDCEKMKDFVDPIDEMKNWEGSYKSHWMKAHANSPDAEWAKKNLYHTLDSRWNSYDGQVTDYKELAQGHFNKDYFWIKDNENIAKRPQRPIEDIWQLHMTGLSTQPWHPRYTSWGYSTHPRQDLMEIYWDYVKKVKMMEKPNYDLR